MKPRPIQDVTIALTALVIALAAAYWLDQAIWWSVQRARQTLEFPPLLIWLPGLAQLADAAGLVILVWWLATRANFPRVIDAIYALAAALSVPLAFATHISFFDSVILTSGPSSCWTMTGAVLAMAGLFHLFRRRPTA